jgi:hypothetical protein
MQQTRLTQSFLGLSDQAFRAIPAAEKAIVDAIHAHIDQHHSSGGTIMAALACIAGEFIVMTGEEAEQSKRWFIGVVDAYVSGGSEGARTGPNDQPSPIRKPLPR